MPAGAIRSNSAGLASVVKRDTAPQPSASPPGAGVCRRRVRTRDAEGPPWDGCDNRKPSRSTAADGRHDGRLLIEQVAGIVSGDPRSGNDGRTNGGAAFNLPFRYAA